MFHKHVQLNSTGNKKYISLLPKLVDIFVLFKDKVGFVPWQKSVFRRHFFTYRAVTIAFVLPTWTVLGEFFELHIGQRLSSQDFLLDRASSFLSCLFSVLRFVPVEALGLKHFFKARLKRFVVLCCYTPNPRATLVTPMHRLWSFFWDFEMLTKMGRRTILWAAERKHHLNLREFLRNRFSFGKFQLLRINFWNF